MDGADRSFSELDVRWRSTIMGVETNAMQFYPEASNAEAIVHPGLYQRRNGMVDFGTIWGDGFGYRTREIKRALPEADLVSGEMPQRA